MTRIRCTVSVGPVEAKSLLGFANQLRSRLALKAALILCPRLPAAIPGPCRSPTSCAIAGIFPCAWAEDGERASEAKT